MSFIQPSDFINLGKVNEYVTICENKAYNQALEDFYKALEKNQQDNWVDNLEYGITFADVEEVISKLKK